VDEALFVQAQQVLHEGRAAPGWGDDEDRFLHRLLFETGEEYVVQRPAQNNQGEKYQKQPAEQQNKKPAPQSERHPEQHQVFRLQK
jgi:hypothetical protein